MTEQPGIMWTCTFLLLDSALGISLKFILTLDSSISGLLVVQSCFFLVFGGGRWALFCCSGFFCLFVFPGGEGTVVFHKKRNRTCHRLLPTLKNGCLFSTPPAFGKQVLVKFSWNIKYIYYQAGWYLLMVKPIMITGSLSPLTIPIL